MDRTDDAGNIIFKLSEEHLAIVREIYNAHELVEMQKTPGFERFAGIAKMRIEQIEAQFMDPKKSFTREVAWVMRERLVAVKEFWNSMLEGLEIAEQTLRNPREIMAALEAVKVNPADLDGEMEG